MTLPQVLVVLLASTVLLVSAQRSFAITDKVGQGNFAFARQDGQLYRLVKRDIKKDAFAFRPSRLRDRFAKHSADEPADGTGYAFAKRSVDMEPQQEFAKRAKFAFA